MIELFFRFTGKGAVLRNTGKVFFLACSGGLLYGPAVNSEIRQIR
jgi:hypothetical protein